MSELSGKAKNAAVMKVINHPAFYGVPFDAGRMIAVEEAAQAAFDAARAEGPAPVSARRSPADQDQQLVDQMRAAHARVWTEQGWRSEQSLRDGYEVWTLDSTGQRRIILARGCTPNVAALMCIVSTGLTRLCDLADAPVSAPLDREGVARIIEPNAWACLDALILNLTQGIAGDVNTLRRALRDGVTTEAELKAWWLTPNDLDTYAEKDCRRSLAKADAILALSQQDVDREASAWAWLAANIGMELSCEDAD